MSKKQTIADAPDHMIIRIGEGGSPAEAEILSARLGIPVEEDDPDVKQDREMILFLDHGGLALRYQGQMLRGDFTGMKKRLQTGNLQREMLVRAVRVKSMEAPYVIDATAGLGEDSIILAAAGCRIRMYERDPVIAALLKDALSRAEQIPELYEIISRMQLIEEDSVEALGSLQEPPDVILLDPMFPERQKSAQVKKKFQLLHHLERPCEDEESLLQAAILARPRKIVIKRPLKGAFLAGRKPDYSLKGKAVRYDVLVFAR